VDAVPVVPSATVLDLGAGTARLTRLLANRFAPVVAVERDAALRELIGVGVPLAGTEAIRSATRAWTRSSPRRRSTGSTASVRLLRSFACCDRGGRSR
jgi:hypothetical protein